MKEKKIGISYKGEKIKLNLKVCRGFQEAIGLMFSRREKAKALLFEFKNPINMSIHSWFVFYDFLAIWLDENNNIIDKKIISPFQFSILPSRKFQKLIEIPINRKYSEIISILVGSRKI